MDRTFWQSVISNQRLTGQALPFDRSFAASLPSKFVDVTRQFEIDSKATNLNQCAIAALAKLLKVYGEKSEVLLSLKNNDEQLIPIILNVESVESCSELIDLSKQSIHTANSNDALSIDALNQLFSQELNEINVPLHQCGFFEVTELTQVPSQGYLNFFLILNEQGVLAGIRYESGIFDHITVQRILDNWNYALHQMLSVKEQQSIESIDIISEDSKHTLLHTWNQTKKPLANLKGIHHAFEQQVDASPNSLCVRDLKQSYTYEQLDHEANHIAHALISSHIATGDLVSVALPRNNQLLSSIMGVFKAGAAYVPLDPDFPDDRLAYMAEHSKSKVLITCESLVERLSFFEGTILTIQSVLAQGVINTHRPNLKGAATDTAYVIYTSGSTGKPKGVEIAHIGAINLLESMSSEPGLQKNDVLCAITTLSFDISVVELFLPLYTGASIIIVPKEVSLYADKLINLLDQFNATVLQATPATFRLLVAANWKPNRPTKIISGGEPFPRDLANEMLDRVEAVWNAYGPTETTVWSTVYHITEKEGTILIGSPLDNTDLYILDDHKKLRPIGMPGNLYIGGVGLAKGYLHQPELTQERFIESPFNPEELIYETGDMARYTATGEVECLGRNDGQVKIRGYRIELGEIDAIISQFPDLKSQVVIVREDAPGDIRLAGYYLTHSGKSVDITSLKQFLAERLPKYMVPAQFVHMEEFPMTLNYKIDRNKLPKPSEIAANDVIHRAETKTEITLHNIWAKTLSIKSIDVEDNFFDIGGNSLLSVKIFSGIHKQFGVNLPLDTLFHYSSIRALASRLDQAANDGENSNEATNYSPNLVAIQPSGSGNPVFFFHGVGGNVLNYIQLVKSAGSRRPVYGLQSSGVDGVTPFVEDYETMIEDYLKEIRAVQEEGPYTLVGGSMGGITAVEIAARLRTAGEDVENVIMFDSYGPNLDHEKYGLEKTTDSLFTRGKNFIRYRYSSLVTKFLPPVYSALNLSLPHKVRYQLIENHNYKLLGMRTSSIYDGPATLLRVPMKEKGLYADPNLGWTGAITQDLQLHFVEGNHTNIVESKEAMAIFTSLLG